MKKPIVEIYFRKPYISQANQIDQIKFKQSFKKGTKYFFKLNPYIFILYNIAMNNNI